MDMYLKRSLAVVAAAAILLPVVGQSSVRAARPAGHVKASTTLIWFMRTDPNETPWEKAEVAAFEKVHPEIQINLITAPNANGQFDLKFNQLIQAGTPADIWSHLGQAGFADYYHRGLLLNVSPLLKSTHYSFGATPLNLVNTYKKPDGIYAIPSITLGSYLYYNKDIFDAYNALHPTAKIAYPGVNWDDKTWTQAKVLDIAKKLNGLTIKTASGTTTSYGFNDGQWPPMAIAFQAGSDMFKPNDYVTGDPKTIDTSNTKIVAAFAQIASYYTTLKLSPPFSKVKQIGNTGGDPFQSGNVAMYTTGGWGFRNYLTSKFHWAAAPIPWQASNKDTLFTDPYMVAKTTKNPTAALTFIAFLTNNDSMTSYIKAVGFTPSNTAFLGAWYAQYSKITGMSIANLKTLVVGARKYGQESPNHLIDNFSQIVNAMTPFTDKINYGQGTAASVLPQMQSAINAILTQNAGH
jgi:multiple sugar transport system substrate-binding protein